MINRGFKYSLLIICYIILFQICVGCGYSENVGDRLCLAESLIESHPDSALTILECIDSSDLYSVRLKARYALLKSMVLDKNYIDTTSFEVLQPAIDYYLVKGNANERLRTHYYQGRIHENAGADDLAMQSYLKGLEYSSQISDSLTLARLLIAQGALYYKEYLIKNLIENNLKAAQIYHLMNRPTLQLKCNLRALHGEILLHDKSKADSLMMCCKQVIKGTPSLEREFRRTLLFYNVKFGNNEGINHSIKEVQNNDLSKEIMMNIAMGYSKLGKPELGLTYLENAKIFPYDIFDSLTYWSVKSEILERMGNDKEALDAFRNYSRLLETYHMKLFSNELLFSEKKHEMEVENMKNIQKKNEIIVLISVGVIFLLCVAGLIYYRYRLNRAGRLIAEQKAEKLQLEGEKLLLEADNLRMMVGQLEGERSRLSSLLEKQGELSEDLRRIVEDRLKMLNGLLASEITKVDSHAKEYKKYVEAIKKDSKKFQREIRRDLETTYPDFFRHLAELGLTTKEIDYVCLYAIGLRGKEIGVYLEASRHYSVSSGIRRKLGLDSRDENLGPYIRKLMTENQ